MKIILLQPMALKNYEIVAPNGGAAMTDTSLGNGFQPIFGD
jgi:hypothetical protein